MIVIVLRIVQFVNNAKLLTKHIFCHITKLVKYFDWNEDKNKILKEKRGISFEEIKLAVEGGDLLDTYNHPNQKRYPGQKIMVIKIDDYAYLVPYIRDTEKVFLKTIIPSRKATKKYLGRRER